MCCAAFMNADKTLPLQVRSGCLVWAVIALQAQGFQALAQACNSRHLLQILPRPAAIALRYKPLWSAVSTAALLLPWLRWAEAEVAAVVGRCPCTDPMHACRAALLGLLPESDIYLSLPWRSDVCASHFVISDSSWVP